jgi:predicted RNase H-like HicB family nuclease/DNA-binding XRE family transcriptional regulator
MENQAEPLIEDPEDEEEELKFEPFTDEELAEARKYSILIQWSPEQDIYMALVPEIPGLKTHGKTQEEALEMGVEVIALWIDANRNHGEPIPRPDYFFLRPKEFSAEDVREIRSRLRVTQARFAKMLNVSVSTIRAWEQDLRQPDGPTLRLLELAERHPEVLMESAKAS